MLHDTYIFERYQSQVSQCQYCYDTLSLPMFFFQVVQTFTSNAQLYGCWFWNSKMTYTIVNAILAASNNQRPKEHGNDRFHPQIILISQTGSIVQIWLLCFNIKSTTDIVFWSRTHSLHFRNSRQVNLSINSPMRAVYWAASHILLWEPHLKNMIWLFQENWKGEFHSPLWSESSQVCQQEQSQGAQATNSCAFVL